MARHIAGQGHAGRVGGDVGQQVGAGGGAVLVVDDGQPVALGGEQDGWVQVLDGLADDAQIVSLGQAQLSEGDAVTIVNRTAANLLPQAARSAP